MIPHENPLVPSFNCINIHIQSHWEVLHLLSIEPWVLRNEANIQNICEYLEFCIFSNTPVPNYLTIFPSFLPYKAASWVGAKGKRNAKAIDNTVAFHAVSGGPAALLKEERERHSKQSTWVPGMSAFQCVNCTCSSTVHWNVPLFWTSESPVQKYLSGLNPTKLVRNACSYLLKKK